MQKTDSSYYNESIDTIHNQHNIKKDGKKGKSEINDKSEEFSSTDLTYNSATIENIYKNDTYDMIYSNDMAAC